MLVTVSTAVAAQSTVRAIPTESSTAGEDTVVTFSADQVSYDSDADVVTASGEVRMNREGSYLAADEVTWDRKSGQVYARGNVVMTTPEGDKLVGDNVQLTDTMHDGVISNLSVALESGGRLAASRGTRVNGVNTFYNAIYSPCPVTTPSGCPKRPSWSITAARVIDDPNSNHIRFEGGRFQLFGVNLPLLPVFKIARGNEGITGWLVPQLTLSEPQRPGGCRPLALANRSQP